MPRTRDWQHLLKVRLGCARRPGREPFQTGPAGGTAYNYRYKNSTHRLPFFCGGAFYCVCWGHRHCLRQVDTNFRAARTPDDQAPAVKRTQWDWTPEAQVEALLWLSRIQSPFTHIFRAADNLQALNKSFSCMLNLGLLSAPGSGSSVDHYWSAIPQKRPVFTVTLLPLSNPQIY